MSPLKLKVDNEIKTKVDAFRERITREAEHLVANFFPNKLLELDHFLTTDPRINVSELTEIHSEMNLSGPDPALMANLMRRRLEQQAQSDGGGGGGWEDKAATTGAAAVFAGSETTMKSNAKLVDLIEKVKPEIKTLIEKCNTVQMWVQLLVPKIEDGNNFGVSIQEETIAELRVVALVAFSYLDHISRYYITRAQQMSKIVRHPQVEDYWRTIVEIDENIYVSLKIIVSDLRNYYVTLHDTIMKNIEKIRIPRSSNTGSLY